MDQYEMDIGRQYKINQIPEATLKKYYEHDRHLKGSLGHDFEVLKTRKVAYRILQERVLIEIEQGNIKLTLLEG